MNTNATTYSGQIDLLSLLGASVQNINGKDSVVIPVADNPSIFSFTARSGQPKAMLDILVRETAGNQYGNSHFLKASVGRANREKLHLSNEELRQFTPIIGNLRPLEPREVQRPLRPSAPEPDGDMPESTFAGF